MAINFKQSSESGFALLLAIVIASILLSIGLTLLSTTVKQLTLSSIARESEIAFHASSAGLECAWYHRVTNVGDEFTTRISGPGAAPNIACFEGSPDTRTESLRNASTNGYTNEFNFEFSWDNHCSQMDVYVMVAESGDYTEDFSDVSAQDFAPGDPGTEAKTCPSGSTCSVAISRGYNRACGGSATVEREITAQF